MKSTLLILFSICLCPVWGQIAQSHPEYCGIPGWINPPLPDVSATIDPRNSHVVLYIGHGSAATAGTLLDGLITEISEICPLSDGRLVVFGDTHGALAIAVVDTARASVVDSFWASGSMYMGQLRNHPVLSPNQRWIAYVKFYPLYVAEASEEIMLYDLSKTPPQSRPPDDLGIDVETDLGTLIFPPGHENFPGSNIDIDLPEDQRHVVGQLYWAPSSHAVLFTDQVTRDRRIVLVTLDEHGTPSVFRHALTQAEICGHDVPSDSSHTWKLDRAEFGPDPADSGAIRLEVSSIGDQPQLTKSRDDRCAPHVMLQLRREDFQPMMPELHVRPPKYTPGPDEGPGKRRRRDKRDK